MNIPNFITVIRFGFIPLFFIAFFSDSPNSNALAFSVLIVAGISDVVDGYIARKSGQVTDVGKMLDPLADKAMMLSVLLAFILDDRISWWAASLFILRDVGMIITSAFFHFQRKRIVPQANLFGKATTVFCYVVFMMIMFQLPFYHEALWALIIFALLTTFIYALRFVQTNDVKRASH